MKLRRGTDESRILVESGEWTRPCTPEEKAIAAEIAQLPTVPVKRDRIIRSDVERTIKAAKVNLGILE